MKLTGLRQAALGALTAIATVGLVAGPLADLAGASSKVNLAPAKKALLVKGDMPKGWTSSKSSGNGNSSFPGESQLAACIGVPLKTLTLNPPSANSPEFDNPAQTLTVDDSVSVFSSAKVATSQYAAISNPKTAGCYSTILNGTYKKQFENAFGSGSTIGTISVTSGPAANFPPHTAAITLAFTVVSQGETVPVASTEVFFIKGALGQQIGYSAFGTTFPASLAKHLTTVAVGRL